MKAVSSSLQLSTSGPSPKDRQRRTDKPENFGQMMKKRLDARRKEERASQKSVRESKKAEESQLASRDDVSQKPLHSEAQKNRKVQRDALSKDNNKEALGNKNLVKVGPTESAQKEGTVTELNTLPSQKTGKLVSLEAIKGTGALVDPAMKGAAAAKEIDSSVVSDEKVKMESALSKSLSTNPMKTEVQFLKEGQKNIEMSQQMPATTSLAEKLQKLESSELPGQDVSVLEKVMADIEKAKSNMAAPKVASAESVTTKDASSLAQLQNGVMGTDAPSMKGSATQGEGFDDSSSSGSHSQLLESFGGLSAGRTGENTVETSSFASSLSAASGKGEGENIDNMSSIVRQVRTFIKDGGGSMNIELSPEGMGNINLKVAVEKGQVNVEMLADSSVAKKALEDNLFEMKPALEAKNLLVDNLKVDFAKDYDKDFSQSHNFKQEQQNRDDAQQFMESFQQARDERVQSLFSGLQSYMRDPLRPELELSGRRERYMGKGKGQSVNLVA